MISFESIQQYLSFVFLSCQTQKEMCCWWVIIRKIPYNGIHVLNTRNVISIENFSFQRVIALLLQSPVLLYCKLWVFLGKRKLLDLEDLDSYCLAVWCPEKSYHQVVDDQGRERIYTTVVYLSILARVEFNYFRMRDQKE